MQLAMIYTAESHLGNHCPFLNAIRRYWPSDRESMTFEEVCKILRQEPVVNEADLLRAFERFDVNGDGFVSLEELHRLLTTKGEIMDTKDVKKIFDNADSNNDGKLNYK